MKIIFDTFERALEGTPYEKSIRELFKYLHIHLEEFLLATKAVGLAQWLRIDSKISMALTCR
jgi:hypothetical protein